MDRQTVTQQIACYIKENHISVTQIEHDNFWNCAAILTSVRKDLGGVNEALQMHSTQYRIVKELLR